MAEQRFGDAEALIATGVDDRANGAQYLLGFVIEILLKGRLLDHPAFADKSDPLHNKVVKAVEHHHDFAKMCDLHNDWQGLYGALRQRGVREGIDYERMLQTLAGEWTVFARYATAASDLASARTMRGDVKNLKEILK